jgi:hypothetical protein
MVDSLISCMLLEMYSPYATGARDYINFCIAHSLPLDPTPSTLSRYVAYTSQFIASAPKYLTGVRHFLHDRDIYPDFDANRADTMAYYGTGTPPQSAVTKCHIMPIDCPPDYKLSERLLDRYI